MLSLHTQKDHLRDGLWVLYYCCVSSLSSFSSMEAHGKIHNTKFIIDRYFSNYERDARTEKRISHIDSTITCRVEGYLVSVSLRHVFLLMLREKFLEDYKEKYLMSASAETVTLIGLIAKKCLRLLEEGFKSEEIVHALTIFCEKCIQHIRTHAVRIKENELRKFLHHIHSKAIQEDNEPLRLATETLLTFPLENFPQNNQTLSLLINNGSLNCYKFMGTGRKSFICQGLVLPLHYSNISKLGFNVEGKCILMEGHLSDTHVLNFVLKNCIKIVFCTGEIAEPLRDIFTNHQVYYMYHVSQKDTHKISHICDILPLPSVLMEELFSEEQHCTEISINLLEGFEHENIYHTSVDKYVTIHGKNFTSTVISCIICCSSSKVRLYEEKYWECLVFLWNCLKQQDYTASKLHTLTKCMQMMETYSEPLQTLSTLPPNIFYESLRDMLWIALSTSGLEYNKCHSITQTICSDQPLESTDSMFASETDTLSLERMFEIVQNLYTIILNTDIVIK
ncbi:hypothetical protein C9374_008727 [Naegleria lovaniensis]|uniref:Uncharacterized protein n=1 Tax=Naegleria lovaniensis TaxID=51637 RepID=A0AA88GJA3_NAELO|nr:uncharacterized protein C9374_008727 [Naegleria lovaniensis]KAG2378105.1 hypothetical protein C9374_008727 [Naegleria lovaniensis]